ncbi:MAG: hypothetical protein CSA11_06270 [Chloroflexi bacterium]|nr:MAG: hypothetical protein CSA11_06270 [Chloroflexota bacterium]
MGESSPKLIQTIDNQHLALFAQRLRDWLLTESIQDVEETGASPQVSANLFTESRAKALLKATNAVDDATLHDFARLVEQETAVRLALHDITNNSGLADKDEVQTLAAVTNQSSSKDQQSSIAWLSLSMAAFAWKSGYPLNQLDPATPPETYSPAGQAVKRTAHFLRQQIQRSATERDKLARQLSYNEAIATDTTPNLDSLQAAEVQPPLPPYYRPPVPVNYPEMSNETVSISQDEPTPELEPDPFPPVTASRNAAITITEADLDPGPLPNNVTRMPAIRVTTDQVYQSTPSSSAPSNQVVTPGSGSQAYTNFTESVRQTFGRKEPMGTTKLRVLVQEYPDGPGLYGLQVRVTCQGIKSYVAGTTNRDGKLLCELPVRLNSGLTYDVDVTWPREMNSEIERKSITLNADRTEFNLPFYRKINRSDK